MPIYALIEKATGRFAGSGTTQLENDTYASTAVLPHIPEGHEVLWDFDTETWNEIPVNVWLPDISYAVGREVRYERNTYTCLQDHASQVGWEPPIVPALWESIGYAPPKALPAAWVANGGTGVSGSYVAEALVSHPNPNQGNAVWVYRSKLAANTTEPGQDGTLDRWWEPVVSAEEYTRWLNADGTPVLPPPSELPDRWVQGGGSGVNGSYNQDINWGGTEPVMVVWDRPQDDGQDWVFRSTINANTAEPSRDSTFDRWWEPVSRASEYHP